MSEVTATDKHWQLAREAVCSCPDGPIGRRSHRVACPAERILLTENVATALAFAEERGEIRERERIARYVETHHPTHVTPKRGPSKWVVERDTGPEDLDKMRATMAAAIRALMSREPEANDHEPPFTPQGKATLIIGERATFPVDEPEAGHDCARNVICALCHAPATGYAFIDDDRYCHEGASPTCYERKQVDSADRRALDGIVADIAAKLRSGDGFMATPAPATCQACHGRGWSFTRRHDGPATEVCAKCNQSPPAPAKCAHLWSIPSASGKRECLWCPEVQPQPDRESLPDDYLTDRVKATRRSLRALNIEADALLAHVSKPREEKRSPMEGDVRSWTSCPVCMQGAMKCTTDRDGNMIIECVNLACRSNGGAFDVRNKEIASLRSDKSRLESVIRNCQNEVNEMGAVIASLRADLGAAQHARDVAYEDMERKRTLIFELGAGITGLSQKLRDSEANAAELQANYAEACRLLNAALDVTNDLRVEIASLRESLAEAQNSMELIATPKRADGTYNRNRDACGDLARAWLAKERGER